MRVKYFNNAADKGRFLKLGEIRNFGLIIAHHTNDIPDEPGACSRSGFAGREPLVIKKKGSL
jgi:hypothetical protein